VAGTSTDLGPYRDLIADELNVKAVHLVDDVGEVADLVLQVNPSVLGPRLGSATQQVISAVRRGAWARGADGGVEVAGHSLAAGEYFLSLVPKDQASARSLPGRDAVVSIDIAVTAELAREGMARDVVRRAQEARKAAGLDVSDHIRITIYVPDPELRRAVEEHADMIAGETLADELVLVEGPIAAAEEGTAGDGAAFYFHVERHPAE
jgi:isoleucyl-tRNA synthetase